VTFEPFAVVVVPFPFTDRPAAKRRPALVVSASEFNDAHGQVILAMITTARRSDWPSDVPLRDWRKAGLTTQCRVRLGITAPARGTQLDFGPIPALEQSVSLESVQESGTPTEDRGNRPCPLPPGP
jgi:mRNA interferase MazF